ncbi:MAG: alpha/beta fold hydrolase [Stellaceae bacterium]
MLEFGYDTVELGGVGIRVARGGTGSPLLFLHDAWVGASITPFHKRLAQRFDVIIPEHPGYGGGDAPPWLERITDLASFYLDFLDAKDLRDVHIAGASLGGWVAAELAIRNTSRLASLTLIDPWGIQLAGVTGIDPFAVTEDRLLPDLFVDPKLAEDALARIMAPEAEDALLKGRMITAKLGWQPRLHDPGLAKWLHRIDRPTLILWGDQDRLLPPAYGAAWQQAIPKSRRATLTGAGHLPHLEKPQETADLITDFIASGRVTT